MEVVINGKSEAGDFSTVEQMLRERGLDPYLVVVELNGKILQKQEYATKKLQDGDTVEIVQFVAGG
ncbi:MAG: sulfur carrier protein ThiS [Desulfovibrio sp.]|jgi:sulfur carrier protein